MKSIITEDHIEQNALEILKKLGYEYLYGPDIEPEGKKEERSDFKEPVLIERLKNAIERLNPNVPKDAKDEALKKVIRTQSPKIETDNKEFHRLLIEGVPVSYRKNGSIKHDSVKLMDFKSIKKNEFLAINQFTIVGEAKRRTDILLYINGLPLVLFELKNLADENASVYEAFKQIQTYKDQLPQLFRFNEICIVSDGQDARTGTLTSNFDRFMPWKSIDGKKKEKGLQLETLIKGMLNKETLLDLIQNFITYEKERDVKNNTTRLIKKLAAYHQYNAVNRAIESTIRAMKNSSKNLIKEEPEFYGLPSVKEQKKGDKRAGIVWHTQGSGKSLSMIFYSGKLVLSNELKNPTIVVLTDRNDLDGQLFDTFAKSSDLLRQEPIQAKNRSDLRKKLKRTSGGVIFTTIQKFFPEKKKEKFPCLSERENIVVIADEAHRTQYGFNANVDKEKGRITYGFAKYLRDALPNASFIGFTGTPIEKADKNTPAVFGKYVDVYDIKQSVEDGATVKLLYESRLAKLDIKPEERLKIDPAVEEISEDDEIKTKLKSKWSRMAEIIGSHERLRKIAKDIINHFEERIKVLDGKGMIVCMSRKICVDLYNEIVKLRPEWHNENDNEGIIKVIMTGSASDSKDWQQHIRNKSRRTKIGDRLKDPNDELRLVIVRDMWLTGFDAPSLHTLYIDKPMKGHTLMQAIARANRKYKDKEAGLIVDYIGLGTELKKSLATYSESGGKGKPVFEQKEAIRKMEEKYNVVRDMFYGFDYKKFFKLPVNERVKVIPEAIEFILKEKGKKERFVKETGLLVKSFSLSVPSNKAMKLRDEVGFFQAIKSSIVKTTSTKSKYGEEYDSAIKQIIEKSVVSDRIIDLFEAAGIEKPDMSILSDKFLLEVKDMKQKNLAFEALKRLLNDELKMFSRKNITLSKSFIEMLEKTIKRYTDQSIDAAQAIEELIRLSKRYKEGIKKGEEMGLSQEEKAFYDALAGTGNVSDLLGDEVLRKMALEVVKLVKKSAKVDWSKRKSIQAELRYQVKKVLHKYGYPPTKRADATELILEQARTLAENEVSKNETK